MSYCLCLLLFLPSGLNGYNIDPTSLAMDYRSVGFRECAAEVARYLVTVEGLDIQDPLRLRLMSHLQCYSAQREAASKVGIVVFRLDVLIRLRHTTTITVKCIS